MVPSLPQYMIVLFNVLLATVPTYRIKTEFNIPDEIPIAVLITKLLRSGVQLEPFAGGGQNVSA